MSIIPPRDLDAEKSLLGSILLNSKILDDVTELLKPDYFYDPMHAETYKIMLKLWSSSKPVDIIFVLDNNTNKNLNKQFLVDLVSKSSLSSTPSQLGQIVKEKYLLRQVIILGEEIKELGLTDEGESEDILEKAQKKIYDLALNQKNSSNFVALGSFIADRFGHIQNLHENGDVQFGLSTGFIEMDKLLGGFHGSDLLILAARPAMGKTALALEFARRVGVYSGKGVAFFSLEMSKEQLVDRMISSQSGIDMWKIRSGKIETAEDFGVLGNAIGILNDAPIWVDDTGGLTVLELRTKIRKLKQKTDIGLVIIDYLQLMSGTGKGYGGNRVQEVSEISRGLKIMAKELNVPVIALSQLSRSVEGREDKRPMLSDLRESGSIEQDADLVMFVHREEYYNKETKKKGIADILISKHRNGAVGTVELAWLHKLASFENLEGAKISKRVNE
jgi:replicative DNA helicase